MNYITALCILFFSMLGWSLPAPQYLNVAGWKDCVQTFTEGSAVMICLPDKKPADCKRRSWITLTGKQLIPACQK